jgi:CBS domain-containing protein
MKIAEWLEQHPRDLGTVHPDCPVETIIDRMLEIPGRRDLYVIAPDGKLMGHIGYHKIACILLSEHRPEHTRRQLMEHISTGNANEIMNPHFVTATPEEELEDILHHQLDHNIEDMPVIDSDGRPVGAINLAQILERYHALAKAND